MQTVVAAVHAARIVNNGETDTETAKLPSELIRFKGVTVLGHNNMLPPREIIADTYQRLIEHAARGELVIVQEAIPLDRVAEAWQHQQSSPHRKLVLIP